jgi:hypothetical protein
VLTRVPSGRCIVVERFGIFNRLRGPGLRFHVPLLERSTLIDPAQIMSGWTDSGGELLGKELVRRFYSQRAPGPAVQAAPERNVKEAAARRAAVQAAREAAGQAVRRDAEERARRET